MLGIVNKPNAEVTAVCARLASPGLTFKHGADRVSEQFPEPEGSKSTYIYISVYIYIYA